MIGCIVKHTGPRSSLDAGPAFHDALRGTGGLMAQLRAAFWLVLQLGLSCACGKPEAAEPVFRVAEGPDPFEVCETSAFGRYSRGVRCKDMYVLLVSRDAAPAALLEGTRINLESYGFAPQPFALRVNG